MTFRSIGLVLALLVMAPLPASAQDKPVPMSAAEEDALVKPFLDKNGGYKDRHGGYFNPKAQIYTDEKGGVLDNWGGYTYKDGSYKSRYGDYFDGPKREFQLSNGEVMKLPAGSTNAEAIKVLRETVAENGGFDKDFIRKAMVGTIAEEHHLGGATPKPR